jgi:hypothetical protein
MPAPGEIATFHITVEKLVDTDDLMPYRVHLLVSGLANQQDAEHASAWLHEAVVRQIVALGANRQPRAH